MPLSGYYRRKNFSRGLLFYHLGLGLWRWKWLMLEEEGFFLDSVPLSTRLPLVRCAHG